MDPNSTISPEDWAALEAYTPEERRAAYADFRSMQDEWPEYRVWADEMLARWPELGAGGQAQSTPRPSAAIQPTQQPTLPTPAPQSAGYGPTAIPQRTATPQAPAPYVGMGDVRAAETGIPWIDIQTHAGQGKGAPTPAYPSYFPPEYDDPSFPRLLREQYMALDAKIQLAKQYPGGGYEPSISELKSVSDQYNAWREAQGAGTTGLTAYQQAQLAQNEQGRADSWAREAFNQRMQAAQMRQHQWQTQLPYQLPGGMEYAPGLEPGGWFEAAMKSVGLPYNAANWRTVSDLGAPGAPAPSIPAWAQKLIETGG